MSHAHNPKNGATWFTTPKLVRCARQRSSPSVQLEAIQDQLKQLTTNKVRSTSPVCFAGLSDSRSCGDSSQTASPARRVRFDRSADRDVLEYHNADGRQREERRSRSTGPGRREWDADSNRESKGTRRPRGSHGHGFSRQQGSQNFGAPQNFGLQSYGSPQNYGQIQNYGPVPNYGPQNFAPQPMPMNQPAYAPPPLNMETGRNTGQGMGFTPITMQCGKCGHAPHSHPNMCLAVDETCRGCGRKGHFVRVCRTMARLQQQGQQQSH